MSSKNRRSVPSWDELDPSAGRHGEAFEEAVVDAPMSSRRNYSPQRRTFRRANRGLRPDPFRYLDEARTVDKSDYRNSPLRQALRDANLGFTSDLLPYRPTPTSEPGRPRTRAAGYDHTSQQLRIEFRNGSRYVYYDVPAEVWEDFQSASSPGRFMNDHIVDVYQYEQETHPYLPDPWPRR